MTDFVENRHDSFRVELLRPSGEFIGPEIAYDVILHVFDHDIAKVLIREGSYHIEHGCSGDIEESEEEHSEDMFELRIPVCTEEFLEDIDKSLRKYLLRFVRVDMERIEGKRELFIRRIEYDNIFFARFGNMHHDFFDEISMWIDDSESFPIVDIIDHHGDKEFTLANPSLPNDIHMTQSIFVIDSEWYADATIIRFTEDSQRSIMREYTDLIAFQRIGKYRHTDRESEFTGIDLQKRCLLGWMVWKMENIRDLFCREDEGGDPFSML